MTAEDVSRLRAIRPVKSDAAAVHQARLQTLRLENGARIAEWLRTAGYSTVAEVATATGLSKPTVKERLLDLASAGVVVEVEKMDPVLQGSGRPASRYSFDANAAYVIGVDMAKHRERIAFANLAGEIILRDDRDVDSALSADTRLEDLHARIQVLASHTNRPLGRLVGLAAAIPGPLSSDNHLMFSAIFSDWEGVDVKARFADRFGVPVHIEHDLAAASIAESMMGSAQNVQNFVLAVLWHQVSAGLFIRGEVYRGTRNLAGELFRLSSRQQLIESREKWGSDPEVAVMVAAAEAGDAAAMESTKLFAALAAEQIASLIVAVDPEVLYLYGPAIDMPLIVDLVREEVATRINPVGDVPIELSSLGQDGPLLGVTLQALADATASLIGPSAAPPRLLFEGSRPQLSQSARERTG